MTWNGFKVKKIRENQNTENEKKIALLDGVESDLEDIIDKLMN